MIPYEELDRALARWKARTQGGAVQGDDVAVESAAIMQNVPIHTHEHGSVPQRIAGGTGESTGELDLESVETVIDD